MSQRQRAERPHERENILTVEATLESIDTHDATYSITQLWSQPRDLGSMAKAKAMVI